jgi:hypothetical protein
MAATAGELIPGDPTDGSPFLGEEPAVKSNASALRLLVDSYVQVQRVRVQIGARARAAGALLPVPSSNGSAAAVATFREDVFLLESIHANCVAEEARLLKAVQKELQTHPAWQWLRGVKGVGPSLAGKLLARLDPEKAPTPSSFWAYCGLATVPGVEYRCEVCGLRESYPGGHQVRERHLALNSMAFCSGRLRSINLARVVRVAQPRLVRGQSAAFDSRAKHTCYLLGVSLLRSQSTYAAHYARVRERLAATRHGWVRRRLHLSALRATEKLFLAHLWLVWRQEVGLPTASLDRWRRGAEDRVNDPWQMVG